MFPSQTSLGTGDEGITTTSPVDGEGDDRMLTQDEDYQLFKEKLRNEWEKYPNIPDDNDSRMNHLLETRALTDVTFLVGDEKTEVRAHKFILRDVAVFFSTLFSDRWRTQNNDGIEIPGVDPVDFQAFLQFLYTGRTEFKKESALPLLYLSRVYDIPTLGRMAVLFLINNMSEEIAIPVWKSMYLFDDPDAKRLSSTAVSFLTKNMSEEIAIPIWKSMSSFDHPDAKTLIMLAVDFIRKNPSKVFLRSEFAELSYEDMNLIMSGKIRHPDEALIFESCVRWAAAECSRQLFKREPQSYRTVLKSVIKHIRFPLIKYDGLSEELKTVFDAILTKNERDALMLYWKTDTKSKISALNNGEGSKLEIKNYFKLKPRDTTIFSVNRFSNFKRCDKSWTYSQKRKSDRISFQVTTTGTILGIGLYGSAKAEPTSVPIDYDVDVVIHSHHRMETVYVKEFYAQKHQTNAQGPIFRVMFRKPMSVIPGIWYTISTVFHGSKGCDRSYYGIHGQGNVALECQQYPVIFKFQDAIDRKGNEFFSQKLPSNGTGITTGQIPIIYFSLDDDEDCDDDVQMISIA